MSTLVEAGGLAFLSGIAGGERGAGTGRTGSRDQVARETRTIIAELKARLAAAQAPGWTASCI